MNRKEAIKRTAFLMGGIAFAPNAIGVLNGCTARPGVTWNPKFFNRNQALLITELTDIIIPETDTPGAKQAGVPAFIENMVTEIYNEESRDQFMDGLEAFNQAPSEQYGDVFTGLSSDNRFEFAHNQNRLAIRSSNRDQPDIWFFYVIKELTLLGYFTSEPGATQTLQYISVPGRFDGCVPLDEVGRAWA